MSRDTRTVSREELEKQHACSQRVGNLLAAKLGRQPLACAVTYGCQQNQADSELICGMLTDMGCALTDKPEQADVIILNTCAVREHAEQRVFGNVGALSHLKKSGSGPVIALCGCMAQQGIIVDKVKKSYPHVDMVFGTHALVRFPELLLQRLESGRRVFDISGDERGIILEGVEPKRKKGVQAWLSIMYGCNNFCSYCIVPYVRGRERSRAPEEIERECRGLIGQGYQDITLLGQNVNSYGRGLDGACDFPRLLERLSALPGDFQLRFMTSHPKDATNELLDTMARCKKVCHSLHLPVQSGSDRVLKEMNRSYTVGQYRELVDYARSVMPDLTLTTDLIVGFPGETEEDFEQTLALVEQVRFQSIFTFLYSRRPGTRAAEKPDPVPRAEKQKWFDRLLETQNRISKELNESDVGKTMTVLVDGVGGDAPYTLTARTGGNRLVYVRGGSELLGRKVPVRIDRCSTMTLFGSACPGSTDMTETDGGEKG